MCEKFVKTRKLIVTDTIFDNATGKVKLMGGRFN